MELLVLGGGVFVGAEIVDQALARGHRVTVFNRGRARAAWPPGVEVVHGDRTCAGDLARVGRRAVDAVVDTCGYVPADVTPTIAAFADVGCYCFVSSVSAYASFAHAPVRESDALAASDGISADDREPMRYGGQKAACERVVSAAFGARALVVRPGLVVGPRDPTGRFSHWPWRALAGGEMLVPDAPASTPIQIIDVRDLAAFIIGAIEQRASGAFNVVGPQGGSALDWPRLVAACAAAAARRNAPPLRTVAVDEAFLLAEGIVPWSELPLWLPSDDPDLFGHPRIDGSRAVAAGLATRPIAETIDAVLDEASTLIDGDPRLNGKLTRGREADVIARWRARGTGSVPARFEIAATS